MYLVDLRRVLNWGYISDLWDNSMLDLCAFRVFGCLCLKLVDPQNFFSLRSCTLIDLLTNLIISTWILEGRENV